MRGRWSEHDNKEIKWREREGGQTVKQNEGDMQMKHIGTKKRNDDEMRDRLCSSHHHSVDTGCRNL